VALGYEVIWARIIGLHTLGAVYSFSIMLAVYLLGLWAGGIIGASWLRRKRVGMFHFGAVEIGIGLLAVLALVAFRQLHRITLEDLFGGYSVPAEMATEALFSFLTLFPVTLAIGAAFPVAAAIYTGEETGGLGGRLGRLVGLNTAGSVLGALAAGFILVPVLGLQRSALVLAAVNLGIGLGAVWGFARRDVAPAARYVATTAALVAMLVGLLLPAARYLGPWQPLADKVIFYLEGVETTVAVFEPTQTNPKFSSVNGRVELPTDALSLRAFHLLGHLPAVLRLDASNALMLSFGNGIATGALASHEIPQIDVVEFAPEMLRAAGEYREENRNVLDYPGLRV
jgi:spermidine synthase